MRAKRFWSRPLVALDPSSVELQPALVETLDASGFATQPVGAFALDQGGYVVATFCQAGLAAYADAVVTAPNQLRAVSLRSHLTDGRVLVTAARGETPRGPNRIRQVFRGADLPELVERHRETLADLGPTLPADGAIYFAEIAWIYEDSVTALRRRPVRTTARILRG